MKKLFIWDFHGVLEKDNEYSVQELMLLTLRQHGYEREVSIDEVRQLYGKRWFDYMKHFAHTSDEKAQEMVGTVLGLQQGWSIVQKHIKPREHAAEVLLQIAGAGHANIVVSNTAQEHMRHFLELVGLEHMVRQYHGVDNGTYAGKAAAMRCAAACYDKAFVVGDSDDDIAAGKAAGATTYLFINACNKNRKFITEPDYSISDLRDVLKEL